MNNKEEKGIAMEVIRIAIQDVAEAQERLRKALTNIPQLPKKLQFSDKSDIALTEFSSAVENLAITQHSWLPETLDKIPDIELKGALGVYNAMVSHLELMTAAKEFFLAIEASAINCTGQSQAS